MSFSLSITTGRDVARRSLSRAFGSPSVIRSGRVAPRPGSDPPGASGAAPLTWHALPGAFRLLYGGRCTPQATVLPKRRGWSCLACCSRGHLGCSMATAAPHERLFGPRSGSGSARCAAPEPRWPAEHLFVDRAWAAPLHHRPRLSPPSGTHSPAGVPLRNRADPGGRMPLGSAPRPTCDRAARPRRSPGMSRGSTAPATGTAG